MSETERIREGAAPAGANDARRSRFERRLATGILVVAAISVAASIGYMPFVRHSMRLMLAWFCVLNGFIVALLAIARMRGRTLPARTLWLCFVHVVLCCSLTAFCVATRRTVFTEPIYHTIEHYLPGRQ